MNKFLLIVVVILSAILFISADVMYLLSKVKDQKIQILKLNLNDNDIEDEVLVVDGKFTLYKIDGKPVININVVRGEYHDSN